MYRIWGTVFLILAVLIFSVATIVLQVTVQTPNLFATFTMRFVLFGAFLFVNLFTSIWLWRLLGRHANVVPDLAGFLSIVFVFLFFFVAVFSIIKLPDSENWATYPYIIIPVSLVALCFTLIDLARRLLRIRVVRVPGGTIAVIYRNGDFHRLENSGPFWLWALTDEIAYTIDITPNQNTIRTGIMRWGEIVYEYSLSVSYRLDPYLLDEVNEVTLQQLSPQGMNHHRLVRDAVVNAYHTARTSYVIHGHGTSNAGWFDAFYSVAPDLQPAQQIIGDTVKEADKVLRPSGIALTLEQGVAIERFHMPIQLKTYLTPQTILVQLKEAHKRTDDETVLKIVKTVDEAVPLSQNVEFTPHKHEQPSSTGMSKSPSSAPSNQVRSTQTMDEEQDSRQASTPAPSEDHSSTLTEQDLSVLKAFPNNPKPGNYFDKTNTEDSSLNNLTDLDLAIMKEIPNG